MLKSVWMKAGRRDFGSGWRVSAEQAVGKSVVWREALKRDVRREVD